MNRILILLSFFISSIGLTQQQFSLEDYLKENPGLDAQVDSVFLQLSNHSRVAQLLMPAVGRYGMPEDSIAELTKNERIGGVLLLNGTKSQFEGWTSSYNELNKTTNNLPFFYSADAEPSLVNRKMIGSTKVPRANEIKTIEEVYEVSETISNDLNAVGVNYNFSPVVDMSSNKTVGYRGFGSVPENIVPFSAAFIKQSQKQNIIATAKHFPGHGLVSGDTHKSLQQIDGELKELHNYPPLIEQGVLSIMVAHIAVKNNKEYSTNGAPATTSKKIVTDLLRDSLNFKGLIVTDAMNMGGVVHVENAAIKAVDAGCDIVLMPLKATITHRKLLAKYETDDAFKTKVDAAVKRIIRMKICLGLIE